MNASDLESVNQDNCNARAAERSLTLSSKFILESIRIIQKFNPPLLVKNPSSFGMVPLKLLPPRSKKSRLVILQNSTLGEFNQSVWSPVFLVLYDSGRKVRPVPLDETLAT